MIGYPRFTPPSWVAYPLRLSKGGPLFVFGVRDIPGPASWHCPS